MFLVLFIAHLKLFISLTLSYKHTYFRVLVLLSLRSHLSLLKYTCWNHSISFFGWNKHLCVSLSFLQYCEINHKRITLELSLAEASTFINDCSSYLLYQYFLTLICCANINRSPQYTHKYMCLNKAWYVL